MAAVDSHYVGEDRLGSLAGRRSSPIPRPRTYPKRSPVTHGELLISPRDFRSTGLRGKSHGLFAPLHGHALLDHRYCPRAGAGSATSANTAGSDDAATAADAAGAGDAAAAGHAADA